MVVFESHGPRIVEDDVIRLEQVVGGPLPADYRQFLLTNNGGMPTPFSAIDVEACKDTPTDVQVLFGIKRSIESSELFWNLEIFGERLRGKHLLPIGCDSAGCLFCLSLAQSNYGTIVYFDWDFKNLKGNIYRVAQDFTSFLNKLREFE